jgi:predicted neutral ceramidase superfamily lipid hydrolase
MKPLFKKTGWIYLPVSIAGWIVLLAYAVISIVTLLAIDNRYNSLTNSAIRFFPYFISYSVIYFWIAGNTCNDKTNSG